MNIGEKIRQARKEKKLTQQALAQILGFSQTAIAQYEANTRNLTPQMLKKIADILDKDINYFYYDPPKKDTIKDKEKSQIWELVMDLSNGDKKTALGFLQMLKEGKVNNAKDFEDIFEEFMGTLKITKENELLIKKLLLMVKATGQDKLEALLKLLK